MRIPNFAKNILKRTLLSEALPTPSTAVIYRQLGKDALSERTFYFGKNKLRVASLSMEAAPGTAETVIGLLQSLGANAGQSVLDFGCGQHQSRYLRDMGFKVHSCDILPFNLENFTQVNPASPALPFADNQFDIVIASEVLEHVESPWEILKELARVSKKHVIITTPNPASLKSKQQFLKSGFLYWFAPENFSYHINPIFWWQVELFCRRHKLALVQTLSNHQAFQLSDHGRPLDFAEALIYQIRK